MKHVVALIAVFAFMSIHLISCSEKDETIKEIKPGVYYIDMNLSPFVTTRGIQDNHDFDTKYDPDFIFLHKIGSEENIMFPVYNNCPNSDNTTCKGFCYRIEVDEAGNATITPKNADGSYASESITIGKDETCYFSSWPSDNWEMSEEQISSTHWVDDPNNPYYFYYRDKNINQEIYRSQSDMTVNDLIINSDITMQRSCAGFNVLGLFYDNNAQTSIGGFTQYTMTEEQFKNIMGTSPDEWYIKIYIGGTCFPDAYNIETRVPKNTHPNGYYSSGDGDKFEQAEISDQTFLPFNLTAYASGSTIYGSYGYYTQPGNHLFTPVSETKTGEVHIYILIKHWTGEGEPSEEWLKSDIGALQTTIVSGASIYPINNTFYNMGLVIDLHEFKKAWEQNGGDAGQMSSISATRSPSGAPVRPFTIENAIMIYDVQEGH